MSIESGTIAAKIVGLNQTKEGLSGVLEQWGEEVPQTFAAYPNAFNSVFENLDDKIDDLSTSLSNYVEKYTEDTQTISTPLINLKPLSCFELNAAYGTDAQGMFRAYGTVALNNSSGDKTTLYPARTLQERVGGRMRQVYHNPEIVSYQASTSATYTLAVPYEKGTIATKENLSAELSTKADLTALNDYALTSSLATVATTGSYNDLSDKPTIPTVNNAALTIQKNGSTVATFTANASAAVNANISVPTKTSDLTNDSGFLTAHQDISQKADISSLNNYLPLSGGYETGVVSSDFSCVSAHIKLNENDEDEDNYIETDVLMYSPLSEAKNSNRMKYKVKFSNITTHGTVGVTLPTGGTFDFVYEPSEQMPSYKTSNYLIDYEINSNGVVGFYIAADDNWDPYYGYNLYPTTWVECTIPSYLATAEEINDTILKNTTEFLKWQQKRQITAGENAMAPTFSANVNLDEGIAIGYAARTYKNASNYYDKSIAIGSHSRANTAGTNDYDASIAIGKNAYASNQGSIVIGHRQSNYSNGNKSISIGGRQAHTGNDSVQIGWEDTASYANYTNGVYIGNLVQGRNSSVVVGYGASTTQANNVAIGRAAYANGINSVSIGYNAQGTAANDVCIGYQAKASAISAMQFGQGTNATSSTVQFWDKTLLSGDNLIVVKDRLPTDVVYLDALSDYATTDSLSDYVLTSTLDDYALKSAVNTAIGTINTNFTNLATMIATSPGTSVLTASVGSRASGWTFSSDGSTSDNKVRIYHWGQMGVVFGAAKKSSAITANTNESSLGTITMPSGYSILAAFIGSAGTGEIWSVTSSGTFSIRHFTAKSANTWINFRIVVMLSNIGDRYSRTNVATI